MKSVQSVCTNDDMYIYSKYDACLLMVEYIKDIPRIIY